MAGERDLRGRVFVVTGANTGIGRATAETLALRGGRVLFAGRSPARTMAVVAALRQRAPDVDVDFLRLDLASLAGVAQSASELLGREPRIDCLVANAGLAGHRGLTVDGFEIHFGVNHLGHYLFTRLVLPRLQASAPARVVIVSSKNHQRAPGIDFGAVARHTPSRTGLAEYNVSKLANVLFARELSHRLEGTGVTTYSLNPGRVASDVWRRVPRPALLVLKYLRPMKSVEEGARTSIFCATAPELQGVSGRHYQDCAEVDASPLAADRRLCSELWERSEAWVRPWL